MYTHVFVCNYVQTRVCMQLYTHTYIYIHTHVNTNALCVQYLWQGIPICYSPSPPHNTPTQHPSHTPKKQVWDEHSQPQVLQVLPFDPYKDLAASHASLPTPESIQGLADEMQRCETRLANIRSQYFFAAQRSVGLLVKEVVMQGVDGKRAPGDVVPMLPSVAELIRVWCGGVGCGGGWGMVCGGVRVGEACVACMFACVCE